MSVTSGREDSVIREGPPQGGSLHSGMDILASRSLLYVVPFSFSVFLRQGLTL